MMFPSFFTHAGIAVLAAATTSGPTHAWIADIKARRSALVGQEVRLEGEVMDVRSTSPSARRGYYRLSDASDPVGVLVRSEQVPIDGGSFRLRAKVADDQIVNGTLLLDELARERTDARPIFPIVVALGSGLALALLVILLRRAHKAERRYAVAPPLWLLPDSGPYGKGLGAGGPGQPALKYDADLEEADRAQRDHLKWRKRRLMQALVGSFVLTGSSTAWVVATKPAAGQVPAFIFIDSDPAVAVAPRSVGSADTAIAVQAATIGGDSALRPVPGRRDSTRDGRTSTALAIAPRTLPADPVLSSRARDSAAAMADTVRRDVAIVTPPPSPVPVAPPPPPPPPPPEPVAVVRDPEVDRTRAHARVQESAEKLVAAINARQTADVALMVPESMAGDLGRRDRFLKLVKDLGPRASLGPVEEAAVTDDRGEARITVSFTWRGDFGVDKKKAGHLIAVVRRDGDGWRFEGARLMDAVP